jgi:hypothetical protein
MVGLVCPVIGQYRIRLVSISNSAGIGLTDKAR